MVRDALQKRLDHGIFGYEAVPDGLMPALTSWMKARHGWEIETRHILRSPNILNSLAIAASIFTKAGDGVIIELVLEQQLHIVQVARDALLLRHALH